MRNFKKVIAAGLALLMLALSVNVSFAAESYTDKEAVVVAKVNAAGIMTGTDKGFEPSKTLTRAEAAAIMVRMKGISEDTVKQNAGTTLFTDVAASHWAAGYVNVASNYGIIKGVGANMFAPEKEVTVAEFYTMAIRSLNAGPVAEAEGTWPTNYVNFAIENKLAEDVAQIYTATATRMTAATIVANTLEANMWKKGAVKNGEITWNENEGVNILNSVLDIKEYDHILITSPDVKELKASFDNSAVYTTTTDVKRFVQANYDVNKRANIAAAKPGMDYTIWVDANENEVLGFWVPTETSSVIFTEIKSFNASGDIKLVVNGKETKYKGSSCAVYVNGDDDADAAFATATTGTLATAKLPISGVAYYGTAANSDKLVKLYVENITDWGLVKEVTDKKVKFDNTDLSGNTLTTQITIDLDKDSSYNYKVTKDGKEISIKDIEAGDVVFGYVNPDDSKDYTLMVYNDEVEGKVSAKSGNKITVNGTKYELLAGVSVAAGDEGTFYLAENGKVAMFKAEKKASDVALISGLRLVNSNLADGNAVLQIKYTDMNGTTSDWVEVNGKDSDSTERAKLGTWSSDHFTAATYTNVGHLVAYQIKSGKFVVKANDVKGDASEAYFDEGIEEFKDKSKDTVKLSDNSIWYLANGAKAFEKETYKSATDKDKYEVTLKEVSIDDLDDLSSTDLGSYSYAADLDYKQNTIGLLILEKSNIKADTTWAVVLDVADYNDDDDDTKETQLITVLYAGDSSETEYIAESDITVVAGEVVELSVDGNKIKRVTERLGQSYSTELAEVVKTGIATDDLEIGDSVAGTTAAEAFSEDERYFINSDGKAYKASDLYFAKEYDNGTYILGKYAKAAASGSASGAEITGTRYTIAEDVIVVKLDKGEFKVAKFDDINLLDVDGIDTTTASDADDAKRINDNNLNGAQSIARMVEYTDEDGEKIIVAIIYNK